MKEYSAKYDAYAYFKPLFNNEGKFEDYIFINASSNFDSIIGINWSYLIGRRMTDIIVEFEENIFNLREIYFNMIPKANKKFEKYNITTNRWYLISIFSDENQYLILFINDITEIKKEDIA